MAGRTGYIEFYLPNTPSRLGDIGYGTTSTIDINFGSTNSVQIVGGLALGAGYRPTFVTCNSASAMTAAAYGTHYYLTNSSLSQVTIPTGDVRTDSNAYWVFRNATGTYLSVGFSWPSSIINAAGTTVSSPSPASNVLPIPPSNSLTVMLVNPAAQLGNYGYYSSSNYYSIF